MIAICRHLLVFDSLLIGSPLRVVNFSPTLVDINEISLPAANIRNLVHLVSIMIAREAYCQEGYLNTRKRSDCLNALQPFRIIMLTVILAIGYEHDEYFIDVWVILNDSIDFIKNWHKISTSCATKISYLLPVLFVGSTRKEVLDLLVESDCDQLLKGLILFIELYSDL